MGLFKRIHERAQARVDDARASAEAEASASGASAEDSKAAGDKAARKQRFTNTTRGSHGAGGISGG